ncbi:type 1 glutamine amidotransferase family protein [Rubidibacter lacunae]|uniref:hypothetical protein n=1 Tax=Rubidibacter lacunae TaxID=582514 RepID=UPI000411D1B5|nr:hypothetical protein [Rubidibacter lacunae]
MSENDDHLPCIRSELDWIERALLGGHTLLGSFLGAQAIISVLGAEAAPHPDGEVESAIVSSTLP